MAKKKTKIDEANAMFNEFMKNYEQETKTKHEKARDTIAALCDDLFMNLVHTVELEYSGEGDSGEIDRVVFHDVNGKHMTYKMPKEKETELRNACFEFLPRGFEINEGGYGTVHITIPERKIEVVHSGRIIEIHHENFEYTF